MWTNKWTIVLVAIFAFVIYFLFITWMPFKSCPLKTYYWNVDGADSSTTTTVTTTTTATENASHVVILDQHLSISLL